MHEENDNIRREQRTELGEVIERYDKKILAHEQSLYILEQKNSELVKDISIMTGRFESKCNVVRTLETAHVNLETLAQNNDEIIENQKLIIIGVRKQISDAEGLKSKLAEVTE